MSKLIRMKIKDIIGYLDTIAPPAYQESYDNAGLIVGDVDANCKKAILCLDVTEKVLEDAIEQDCNLVIAHHPIVFSGLKKITGKTYVERIIIKAIQNNIAIYAAHTNLDNVRVGVNKKICDRLDIKDCQILAPKKNILRKLSTLCPIAHADRLRNALYEAGAGTNGLGDYNTSSFNSLGLQGANNAPALTGGVIKIETIFPVHLERVVMQALQHNHPEEQYTYELTILENSYLQVGAGMIGNLDLPMTGSDFLHYLKRKMKVSCLRHTRLTRRRVQRIAVCGGAGSFLLRNAIAQKADVFITADYKYHQFFDADGRIIIADIGHYESEQFTIELFYELLTNKFSNFEAVLTKVNTNPVKYL